jgi:hypothetical protein
LVFTLVILRKYDRRAPQNDFREDEEDNEDDVY